MAERYEDETAEQFSARIFGIVSSGLVSLSIAFGMKTGLFDVLIDHHETPMTSEELADIAGMKERYVREWLGAMTCAHIVMLDPATGKYHLPAHRIDSFKPRTSSGFMATLSKAVPSLSEAFQPMLEIAKKDGPLGIGSFGTRPSILETEEEHSSTWYLNHLLQDFIPSNPQIQANLERGIKMLDVGSGQGVAIRLLAERFPNSHFTGIDTCSAGVEIARGAAKSAGLNNLDYVVGDAAEMPEDWTATFSYVLSVDVLHDTPRPDLIVDEIKRVMTDDGVMSVFEFAANSKHADNIGNPIAAHGYTLSLFQCLPVSCSSPGSLGLGMFWGKDRILEFLRGKGFEVSTSNVEEMANIHFLCKFSSK